MRIQEGERIKGFELSDPVLKSFSELAKNYSTHLHLGSTPLFLNNKLYNSSILISSDGDVRASYQKIHLFDVHIEPW
jgi:predicted amidohydrolase